MVGEATEPLRHSALLPGAVEYLRGDPMMAFVLSRLLTWAIHSSVATILLLAGFAGQGLLPPEVAVPMVLGANFGAGLIAFWLTRGQEPAAKRLPLGNLIVRSTAALLGVGFVAATGLLPPLQDGGSGEQIVNLRADREPACRLQWALLLVCLPLTGLVDRLATALAPDPQLDAVPTALARPASALDPAVIDTPSLALASATRELLRMGETVELMLAPVLDLLDGGKVERAAQVQALDHDVNRAHSEIKLYIARMNRGELTEAEARRGIDLAGFAINLEHAGDLIAKTIVPLVSEIAEHRLRFSPQGWNEICDLHARVMANLQLALNVLVSGELDSARQLVREKEQMRHLERESHDRHLRRLQAGLAESIESSNVHLELLRALKEINSLLATVAYPILSEHGLLKESRLKKSA